MFFRVRHVTTYSHRGPVRLGPYWLRLRPRCDGGFHGDARSSLHAEVPIDVDD